MTVPVTGMLWSDSKDADTCMSHPVCDDAPRMLHRALRMDSTPAAVASSTTKVLRIQCEGAHIPGEAASPVRISGCSTSLPRTR